MNKPEKIDLVLPLEGSEGLDKNQVSRIRAQYLFVQYQTMVTQSQFADAKAAAIMAMVGLLLLRGPVDINISNSPFIWMWYIYMALTALSTFCCLLAIVPRYPNKKLRNQMAEVNLWSWPTLASDYMKERDFGLYMQTSEVSHLIYSIACANRTVAQILLVKFRLLRLAVLLLLVTAVLGGIHLVASFFI